MSVIGTVAEIWRYPVKSMGGERVPESLIAARGLHADRMWAVRDVELDTFTTRLRGQTTSYYVKQLAQGELIGTLPAEFRLENTITVAR